MNLNDLVAVVKSLYPNAMRTKNYTTAVDSSGNASIVLWDNTLGNQPTPSQLTAGLASLTLAQAQATQSATVQSAFNAATLTTIPYMGTTFYTDQQSQFLLLGACFGYTQANAVPTGFAWWDATGKAVPMTLGQLQGLAQAVLTQYNANFVKLKTFLSTIATATTVAAVQAVVWS